MSYSAGAVHARDPKALRRSRAGFTLVELLIVVAIIGILAAIAIPNFVAMQYRAKVVEGPQNAQGIDVAEAAYEAANDRYVETDGWFPASAPGKQAREWTSGSPFDTLAWRPDGAVRGSYSVMTATGGGRPAILYNVDVDGDNVWIIGIYDPDDDTTTFVDSCPDTGHLACPRGYKWTVTTNPPATSLTFEDGEYSVDTSGFACGCSKPASSPRYPISFGGGNTY